MDTSPKITAFSDHARKKVTVAVEAPQAELPTSELSELVVYAIDELDEILEAEIDQSAVSNDTLGDNDMHRNVHLLNDDKLSEVSKNCAIKLLESHIPSIGKRFEVS